MTSTSYSKDSHERNVLFVGESGTGVKTTINAILPYLNYPLYDEAIANIPNLKLGKLSFDDPSLEEGEIKVGIYRVNCNPHTVNISFLQLQLKDKPQLLNHMVYLFEDEPFHAIVFFITAFETRLEPFCQLLKKLKHYYNNSILKHIIFCFTFSRYTFYGPGQGFSALNQTLKKLDPEMSLQVGVNCVFLENEAYVNLTTQNPRLPVRTEILTRAMSKRLSSGSSLNERTQIEFYEESWNKSAKQMEAMLKQITSLTPIQKRKKSAKKLNLTFTKKLPQNKKRKKATKQLNWKIVKQNETHSDFLKIINILKCSTESRFKQEINYFVLRNCLCSLSQLKAIILDTAGCPQFSTDEAFVLDSNLFCNYLHMPYSMQRFLRHLEHLNTKLGNHITDEADYDYRALAAKKHGFLFINTSLSEKRKDFKFCNLTIQFINRVLSRAKQLGNKIALVDMRTVEKSRNYRAIEFLEYHTFIRLSDPITWETDGEDGIDLNVINKLEQLMKGGVAINSIYFSEKLYQQNKYETRGNDEDNGKGNISDKKPDLSSETFSENLAFPNKHLKTSDTNDHRSEKIPIVECELLETDEKPIGDVR